MMIISHWLLNIFIINITWTLAISEKERKFANPPEYSAYKATREDSNKNCNNIQENM